MEHPCQGHFVEKPAFLNLSTLGTVFLRSSVFGDQKHRSSVDDRPGRKERFNQI